MNTSPTTTTCPLVKENGTEIVSPTATGSELTSISLDVEQEQANDDASACAVDASPKAKTIMREVLLRCGRGLAVSVALVIALAVAGKGFVARAHNDPPGTDDMMRNADLGIDSDGSKQVAVALLELEGDGNNVAGYDFTKVDGGVSTARTLEQSQISIIYELTKVGDGVCKDSNNNFFDSIIYYFGTADVDACKAKCGECPGQGQAAGRELRGITCFENIDRCTCYLDDGGLFSNKKSVCVTPGSDSDNDAVGSDSAKAGTGAVCNLAPTTIAECWKVVDSNLQCTTPAPTNEPTSAPSTSPSPTETLTPTALPTSAPTNANITSARDEIRRIFRFHLSSCWYFGFDCGFKNLLGSRIGISTCVFKQYSASFESRTTPPRAFCPRFRHGENTTITTIITPLLTA